MKLQGAGTLVTGGASGLGAETARALARQGAKVAVVDTNSDNAEALAAELGPESAAFVADVTDEEQVQAAISQATERFGSLSCVISCAGVGWAERVVSRRGPAALQPFETVVRINLIGTFNVLRLSAAQMAQNEPTQDGERGVVVMTASVAAYDGQIGQTAYSASKGGVVSLTLPSARDLARHGVRVCTIAPGIFDTPLLAALPEEQRQALGEQVPFPTRLGQPGEYADLALHIAQNPMLNGEVIRLDGALRMPPQ
jgi:NAD(P)-dependent dehydrogenase (short-subunit alcohol dehydrogenase family)